MKYRLKLIFSSSVIVISSTVIMYFWIANSLPTYDGKISIDGISNTVEIIRDQYGIPHINAATVRDAYFGLGYVHAQDRLWQMELNRRNGKGELSEVFGVSTLANDRLMRSLGLQKIAQENLMKLDKNALIALEAYAKGVNGYIQNATVLQAEFYLHGIRPAEWKPEDSLVWLKTMGWNLAGNWWEELLRLRLSNLLTPQQVSDLFPPYPGEPDVELPDIKSLYGNMDQQAKALMGSLPGGRNQSLGSNSWAVAGGKTLSGKPLLANDPHLKLTAPSVWYFAHLHAPGLNVIGASLPGVPGILLGRNDQVAWSFTNTGTDTQDLYIEKVSPQDASRYQTPNGEAKFTTREEIIKIKGSSDEHWTVKTSRHGPVISDGVEEVRELTATGKVLALSWAGLEPADRTLQFMLKAATAQNGAELRTAAKDYQSQQQNIVYADNAGTIGLIAAGRVPMRRKDNSLMGLLPSPGWDERYDWVGFIPFEELPRQEGPGITQIVNANQKITPPGYPYWITAGWQPPYRAERIAQLLDTSTVAHSVPSFAAIQMDVKNPVAEQLLPYLLRTEPSTPQEKSILAMLRQWNAEMAMDRAEPLVFAEWLRQLSSVLSKEPLGELYEEVGDYNPVFLNRVLSGQGGQSRWCGDAPQACADAVKRAFSNAVEALSERYGDDTQQWRWGRAHSVVSRHASLAEAPLLSRIFNLSVASPGGFDTVNVSGYFFDAGSGSYVVEAGPSFRAVYDLAQPDDSQFVLSTGESGNVFSFHYRDMLKPWVTGYYIPMVTSWKRVLQEAVHSLVLSPG